MSRETVSIDLNKARAAAVGHITSTDERDAHAVSEVLVLSTATEQSTHPELKSFYQELVETSLGGPAITPERALEHSVSLTASTKATEKSTLEEAAAIKNEERQIGKIAAIAALEIQKEGGAIDQERAILIKATIDRSLDSYNESLHRQIELDQSRNTLSIRKDGVTHQIKMEPGTGYDDFKEVLLQKNEELSLGLSREQIEYTMSSVDQALQGAPAVWCQKTQSDLGFRQTPTRELLLDVTPDRKVTIYSNMDYLVYPIMDPENPSPARILSTIKSDITDLSDSRDEFIRKPGLASHEVPITYMHTTFNTAEIRMDFEVPELIKSPSTKDPMLVYYDTCIKSQDSRIFDNIENQYMMVSREPFHTTNLITALARNSINTPEKTSELISYVANRNNMNDTQRDDLYKEVISNIENTSYAAALLGQQISLKARENGGTLPLDAVAVMIHEAVVSRGKENIASGAFIQSTLTVLGISGKSAEDINSMIIIKQGHDGSITKDQAKERLTTYLGMKEEHADKHITSLTREHKVSAFSSTTDKFLSLMRLSKTKPTLTLETTSWAAPPPIVPSEGIATPSTARTPTSSEFLDRSSTETSRIIMSPPNIVDGTKPHSRESTKSADAADTLRDRVLAEALSHPAISSISTTITHVHEHKTSTPKPHKHHNPHGHRAKRSSSAPHTTQHKFS